MPCILSIETSGTVCSVALDKDGESLYEKAELSGGSHAKCIGVFIQEALQVVEDNALCLDAVAVSSGPGSYTGLRIGVSAAKGVCFGLGIPLIAVSTLELMAHQYVRLFTSVDGLLCPMLDARRMEAYTAIFDPSQHMRQVRETMAEVPTIDTYMPYLDKQKVYFFGCGSYKYNEQNVIQSPNACFISNEVNPQAYYMYPLAEKAFLTNQFVDTAYFEPSYLKEFQATIGKNKVLGNL
ncbi:MAG: tRNA (adenosine(37)-N6)-threonylcarbamoyltransferase complex dimerization subunit type 1 TsaB [Tannerellaceae bacterium]